MVWGGNSPVAELVQEGSLTALTPWLAETGKKAVFRGYLSSAAEDADLPAGAALIRLRLVAAAPGGKEAAVTSRGLYYSRIGRGSC